MKTYETMAQDALQRIHSLEQKKAARQRTARRLLLPAICIGVAGAAALGWHSAGRLQPAPANSTPAASESPAGTDSADATAAGDRIIVGHLPAGAPADNSRKFVPHTEDEVTVQKTQYFGINTRPQVPADLTADPEAGTDDTMRIFRRNGGTGEVYYDVDVQNYWNADYTRSVNLECFRGDNPAAQTDIANWSCIADGEGGQTSCINGYTVALFLQEGSHNPETGYPGRDAYFAFFCRGGVAFRLITEGLSEEETVAVIRSLLI